MSSPIEFERKIVRIALFRTQFGQLKAVQEEILWDTLKNIPLVSMIEKWLATLSKHTKINYSSAMKRLYEYGILNPSITLQAFSFVNHDANVDRIKQLPISESSRQARASAYIAFTRYLSRRFKGIFQKAEPSREGSTKTFYRVHDKVVTHAMNQRQWMRFFEELEKINYRDALIGKITLQGGKRIAEVLSLTIDQLDFETNQIRFKQSKTKGLNKYTVITYSNPLMDEIKKLIGSRENGYVFLSGSGTPVIRLQVANTFAKAGKCAGIPFRVTPRVLRASAVTYLKQQGFSDSDIMKITGHASAEMVHAYDKTDIAENPSKIVNLVG